MTAAVATRRAGAPRRSANRGRAAAPKLKVLDQQAIRRRARRRNALLTLFIVVLIGFFGVALVHAQLVAGQQDLDALRTRIAEAESHRAQVARAVEEAASPESIVTKATTELGMVRAHQPVFLAATVPVREVPTVLPLAPAAGNPTIQLAASATPDAAVTAGISGSAAIEPPAVAAAVVEEQAPAPAAEASSSAPAMATATPTSISTSPSLGGTSISVSGTAAVTGSAAAGGTESSAGSTSVGAAATTGSSIAGSRAVSVGHGSG